MTYRLGDIVDAHMHLWNPLTTPREASGPARLYSIAPRLLEKAFGVVVPRANREFVGSPRWVAQPFLPADYSALAHSDDDAHRVGTVVHIEASWKAEGFGAADESAWINGLTFPDSLALGGIVGHFDPRWTDGAEVLDAHLASTPNLVGIRCSAPVHPDPGVKSWTDVPNLYADKSFLTGFAAVAERGLTFDAWVYAHQLPDVVTLAREYPETTIILNHLGTEPGAVGPRGKSTGSSSAERAGMRDRWLDEVSAVADEPNVVAKLSGYGMPVLGYSSMPSRAELADLWHPILTSTASAFGVDRLVFGSNMPIDAPVLTFGDAVQLVAAAVDAAHGPTALPAAFSANARRIYRIPSPR
ncbi:amidohydrolase family protein [Gordonia sp. HY442]|uniref:amidohydrolase family protein n=1 Tax=Gordonia zhenghanii TaxID=2911516 RepID=UPI001F1DC7A8|nr:amidohydrolase family protein [Gordonia zhenghanii]MCF8602790.1 amidohydrolase family protein [Gordonia zhenghanii]